MTRTSILATVAGLTTALAVPAAIPVTASAGVASAGTTAADDSPAADRKTARFRAVIRAVDPATRATMIGVSWKEGCPVPIDDLRIIDMPHWGFDGAVHQGRLMVHKDIARATAHSFKKLFAAHVPLRRMELIETYDGSDDASMAADNTSAFNCRPVTGSSTRFSVHSYGKAIDINPIENPYVKGDLVLPAAGAKFTNRDHVRPGMIVAGDLATRVFGARGFDWGGDWTSLKDYQHFEIPRT